MPFRLLSVCLLVAGLALIGVAQDPKEAKKETPKKVDVKKDAPAIGDKKAPTAPVAEEPPKDPIQHALKILKDGKIAPDDKSLLDFFRARTLTEDDRSRLTATIHRLGDDDFDVREKASEDLAKAGLSALSILRAAVNNPDVEIARRVEICLRPISQGDESARIVAAALILAHHQADGVVNVLMAYLPSVPDDEVVADGLREALILYTKAIKRIDPQLRKALDDPIAANRAMAARIIGEGVPSERELIRRLLDDPSPKVRYVVASTFVTAGDAKAIPTLLRLIGDGPAEISCLVEDLLCQLLDDLEMPPATISGADDAGRKMAQAAWEKWFAAKGDKVKLSRLTETAPLRGRTIIAEVDGGGTAQGRIWECGPDGKQRWEMNEVGGPVDIQILPGDRLLVAEYYTSRVTERDRQGKILWESPRLSDNTVSAQRLPNGNTLIATRSSVVEYNRAKEKVAEFPTNRGLVFQAIRHRNGNTYVLTGTVVVEFDASRKQVRVTDIGRMQGWGGFEILPNGNFLVANYTLGHRYAEIGANGKVIFENVTGGSPARIQRLRNGNTLVAGGSNLAVVEYDRDKKEVWKVATRGRPFSVRRY
jgi:hypothetical protein